MNNTTPFVLALDFGGTKLAAAVVDTSKGRVLAYQRQLTPAGQGATASIEAMFKLGREVVQTSGISRPSRVGISFGGPVTADRQRVLVSHHVADWEGIELTKLASEAFDCPAVMDNDANAAALGAWAFDAQRQPQNLVYIQISTGAGAGLILNRQLFRGSALAGEFGHLTIQPGGPECTCGKHGCVESVCAGWALARDGRAALPHAAPGSPLAHLSQMQPEALDARMVLQAANEGDPLAKGITTRAFTALGTVIANVICLLDPDMIILGGGIFRSQAVVQAAMQPALERELPPIFKNRCELRYSSLEGLETLLGAALLEIDAISA